MLPKKKKKKFWRTPPTTNKCWQGCREKGTLIHRCWECKLVQPLWKTIWKLLKKLNIDLPYDPAIPLLGIYPKESDSGYYKGFCTPMFIAALFTIANMETAKMPQDGLRKCGTYIQCNFIQPQRMKFCHSQVNRWNWRTSS
jgi:hypothetical protein